MPYFPSLPTETTVPDIPKQKPDVGVKVIELNEAIMCGPMLAARGHSGLVRAIAGATE